MTKKKKDDVTVVSISIGSMSRDKLKKMKKAQMKKAQMMKGGMANGKAHMYAAGGMVKDNAGLRALRASGPKGMEAYNKITKNS
jgi:hypothetical protein